MPGENERSVAPVSIPPRRPKRTTQCIYFPNDMLVDEVKALLQAYPRTSLSAVFAQLLPAVRDGLEAIRTNPDTRALELHTKIFL